MTETKNNKETPLRVRMTEAEAARHQLAADKLGLTKSVYVRWALDNSTTQVLGDKQPQKKEKAPARRRAAPVAETRVEEVEPCAVCGGNPLLCNHPELVPEPVPDVATLFGPPKLVNAAEPALFDDEGWT